MTDNEKLIWAAAFVGKLLQLEKYNSEQYNSFVHADHEAARFAAYAVTEFNSLNSDARYLDLYVRDYIANMQKE